MQRLAWDGVLLTVNCQCLLLDNLAAQLCVGDSAGEVEAESAACLGHGQLYSGGASPALLTAGGGQAGDLHQLHGGATRVVPHLPLDGGGRVALQPRAGEAHSLSGLGSLRAGEADLLRSDWSKKDVLES